MKIIIKGVCQEKRTGKWTANIYIDGKNRYLGRFSTKECAAEAYNDAAEKLYGQFAKLNDIK